MTQSNKYNEQMFFFANDTIEQLRAHRRALHQIPELDFELPQTIAYIRRVLSELNCEIIEPAPSCICAYFDVAEALGNAEISDAIAIRADMDALPIVEASGAEFCSTHPGKMHACGHDGHMAMALTCAQWLDETIAFWASSGADKNVAPDGACPLAHNVLFVFQPAEETTGGAKIVCESGVFERYNVRCIYGFHVWPDLPAFTIATRKGALLARSSETTLTIRGKSSHIAKSAEGNDALLAAAHFLSMAEETITNLSSADDPCLLKFGHMTSGTVRNAISDTSVIEGSLRVFSDDMFEKAKTAIDTCASKACAAYGCTYDLHFSEGYPPVINDPALTEEALSKLTERGYEVQELPEPLLIAEDFAFYQQYLPGTFFLLGTGTGIPLHSDAFNFDEKILLAGFDIYRELLMDPQ